MLNASIVLYHTPQDELDRIVGLLRQSKVVNRIITIDNSVDNRGYGKAHNIALKATIEEGIPYHLVVNTDISFDPDILEQLLAVMEAHTEVGLLMPKVQYPDGKTQYLCKRLPTPLDMFARRFLPHRLAEKRNYEYELRWTGYDKPMNVAYLSGCFMLLRTEAIKEVGLFDERFFMYPEDIDLTRRIHRKYLTLFYPFCTITHNHARASYHSWQMTKVHIQNMCRYFQKYGWLFDDERRKVNRENPILSNFSF